MRFLMAKAILRILLSFTTILFDKIDYLFSFTSHSFFAFFFTSQFLRIPFYLTPNSLSLVYLYSYLFFLFPSSFIPSIHLPSLTLFTSPDFYCFKSYIFLFRTSCLRIFFLVRIFLINIIHTHTYVFIQHTLTYAFMHHSHVNR